MNYILGFGLPSGPEWIIILFVVLLLFGAKRLPELAKGLGKSINEFKKASKEAEDTFRDAMKDDPKTEEKKENQEPKE